MSALKSLTTHRRLLALMARQDMKTSYGRYRFGILWTLAEPLLISAMMFVVFTFIFGSDRGIGLSPFIVYLASGMLPFAWLSSSISKGPRTFRRYGSLITFSKLPVYFWPLRAVSVGGIELVLSIPVIIFMALALGARPSWAVVLVPLGLLSQLFLCLGFSMLGAALGVSFPDIEKVTALLVRIFFWSSPILWSQRNFPEWIQPYLYLNPFHGVLDFYRAAIWPEVLADPSAYLMSGVVIMVIFVAGLLTLRARVAEIRRVG